MISIIIRTKNEERWIVQCLQKILAQTLQDFEVILVDNNSTDKTVEKAFHVYPDIKRVDIEHYKPGFALNEGIRNSKGEYIVCLSAHCLPVHDDWLVNLFDNFSDPQVAGVYGRQIPMTFTPAIDKRDLLVTFGLDKRVHIKDSFFHNANSMIRRIVWDQFPFDETVTNIEDRVWGKEVINGGYKLIYEPEAPVYHHHGIHQKNNKERYEGVVRILEGLDLYSFETDNGTVNPYNFNIVAIISLRCHVESDSIDLNEEIILHTIKSAQDSKFINKVVLSTDSAHIAEKAEQWGAVAPFLRPKYLSSKSIRVDEVLAYSLEQLEGLGYYPDLIVPLEVTYPFRPVGLIDNLIEKILKQGLDTVIAGVPEYRPCWIKREQELVRVDDFYHLRDDREPILVGLPSLGCVTYPEYVRKGSRLGSKIGIFEVNDPRASIEMRTNDEYRILKKWL